MTNPWFRMYAEWAHDPKVQTMPEHMQRRLAMLFCYRCEDLLSSLSDADIAFDLRITPSQWSETKTLFEAKGFIDKRNRVRNWSRRQFVSDSSKTRTKKWRDGHKNVTATNGDGDVTSRDGHGDALRSDQIRSDQIRSETEPAHGAEGTDDFAPWAEAIYALYPYKRFKFLALSKLAGRFAGNRVERDAFEAALRHDCENADWVRQCHRFGPPLCKPDDSGYISDESWMHANGNNPQPVDESEIMREVMRKRDMGA